MTKKLYQTIRIEVLAIHSESLLTSVSDLKGEIGQFGDADLDKDEEP
uniref:Uncharacterized protein n=3 Tax=unclassified Prevotella TaxID=2638335 RepID=A0AB33JKX4_9BACT